MSVVDENVRMELDALFGQVLECARSDCQAAAVWEIACKTPGCGNRTVLCADHFHAWRDATDTRSVTCAKCDRAGTFSLVFRTRAL